MAKADIGLWGLATMGQNLVLNMENKGFTVAVYNRTTQKVKDFTQGSAANKNIIGADTVSDFVRAVHDALYASKICAYTQDFALMAAAAKQYDWALDFGQIAKIWRAGCIIRARFLDAIKDGFDRQAGLANLMLDPYFKDILASTQDNWRKVVATAAQLGSPAPAFGSALNYFDSYRSERLWANMIQAQRDYFGAHTYERIDRQGIFHTDWPSLP